MADKSVNEAETDAFSGLAETERQRPPTCQHETRGRKRRRASLSKDLCFPSTNSDTIEPYEAQMGIDHQAKFSFRAPARSNELTSKNMYRQPKSSRPIKTRSKRSGMTRFWVPPGENEKAISSKFFHRGSYQHVPTLTFLRTCLWTPFRGTYGHALSFNQRK
jgi:hypothetical protein